MRTMALSLAAAVALTATPAFAQLPGTPGMGPGFSTSEILTNPHDAAVMAATPSRIRDSRREMNRGRRSPVVARMSARQARLHARDLIRRADIQCDVAEAMLIAVTDGNIPVIEIDCANSGGLVIADTLPMQATDCLDFSMRVPTADDAPFMTCQLPGNVATIAAARQSAGN